MKKFKGTPGPWEWRKDGYAGSVYNKRGFLVSGNVIPVHEDREDGESWLEMMERTGDARETARLESEANTLLIAAAPELLEALQAAWVALDRETACGSHLSAERNMARKVIAKALGEEQ